MRLRFLERVVWGGVFLLLAEASPLPSPFPVAQAFDPVAGKKVFLRCKSCHTIEKKGAEVIGPNLWGIIGKKAGTKAGFPYSEAMKKFNKTWDVPTLDAYLANPKAVIPGTRMNFVGLKDAKQRADVIAYLNRKGDKPIRLSKAQSKDKTSQDKTKTKAKKKKKTDSGSSSPVRVAARSSLLAAGAGRAETEAYCSVCHSLRLVTQQGLSSKDWDELLDWMVEEQEMQPMEAGDRAKVLRYLAKHYNQDRPNFKK